MKPIKSAQRFLALLLAVVLIGTLAVVPTVGETYGKIIGGGVRLRSEANTDSVTLRSFSAGDTVAILDTVTGTEAETGNGNTWYRVSDGSLTGYVYGAYLQLTPEETPEQKLTFEQQLAKFPASYQSALKELHKTYPNWSFIADPISNSKYSTFDKLVNAELVYPYKVVSVKNDKPSWYSMSDGWYDWDKKTFKQNPSGWTGASREVISYFMDPRNFLNNQYIYIFMELSYNSSIQTMAGLEKLVKGTYLANDETNPSLKDYGLELKADGTVNYPKNFFDEKNQYSCYAEVIMAAAKEWGVSPYMLASTMIQEQGSKGTSRLILGTYPGYENYYNFFNVGASGTGDVVLAGLKRAKSNGWNTRAKSIFGGAELLGGSYFKNGQDTYYYKDFDVKMKKGYFVQYASAVYDARSSCAKLRNMYMTDYNTALVFKIPVFEAMPETPQKQPAQSDQLNNYYFASLTASGLTPAYNRYKQSGYTLSVSGDTTVKYQLLAGTTYVGEASYALQKGTNTVKLKVRAQTGYSRNYTITITASKACTLTVVNAATPTDPTKPAADDPPAVVIKKGDATGDGVISVADLAAVKMHLLGKKKLTGDKLTGGDVTGDGKISVADLAAIKMHLLGKKLIK